MMHGDSVQIIDFGFACSYLDADGKHVESEGVAEFQGNVFFASVNQMNYMSTGRRDDLISLVYLLVYLLNKGNLLDMIPLNAHSFDRIK